MSAGPRLVCLGAGDAFSARWYSSSAVLEADGARLLIDCPHPIRKILAESGGAAGVPLDVDRIAAVALTHLHADHASGLEGFAFYCHFALGRPATLLTHPLVAAELWDGHLRTTMARLLGPDGHEQTRERSDYFQITPLSEPAPVEFGPFAIECRRTIHPVPTFALRIRAGGRTLGWSSDTAFDPGLIAWLEPADLVVHETNRGLHTPYEKLAALPEPLRRRMRLIHYPDDFDLAGSVIEPLVPGRSYDV